MHFARYYDGGIYFTSSLVVISKNSDFKQSAARLTLKTPPIATIKPTLHQPATMKSFQIVTLACLFAAAMAFAPNKVPQGESVGVHTSPVSFRSTYAPPPPNIRFLPSCPSSPYLSLAQSPRGSPKPAST